MIQLAGCAGDLQRASGAPPLPVTANSTPPPYLSTGFPQVVVVSGTDHEMGMQYGEQTAPAIVHNVAIFKSRCYDGHGRDIVTKDMQVWNYYLEKHDPGYKDWLQGIVEGCKNRGYDVDYLDLVMLMVYPTSCGQDRKPRIPMRHASRGPDPPRTHLHPVRSIRATRFRQGGNDPGRQAHSRNNLHGGDRGNG